MKKLIAKIRAILRNRRVRKIWTRTVSSIACLVVFITTYALVLPAITMESEAACGIEAHQHDESCYEERLICNIPESDGHKHMADCYSTTQKLICDRSEHLHTSDCYDEEGNLTCSQEEHQHGEECYEEIQELICGLEESEGHHHDSSCYEKVLTCEKEVHTHSPACYREDAASVAATEHSAIATTTTTSADDAAMDETANASGTFDPAETAAEGYVPTLDELDFRQLLNDYTTIYYHRPEDSTEDSGQITDWQKVTEDTVLGETDILRVYLAYTIPAGSLNETNATARYCLPGNLHLTDEQMEAINQMENGLSGLYVDYDTLQITDTEKHSAYLGAEAVDGIRTPDQKIEDYLSGNNDADEGEQTAQEIISAVVKADQVYDEDGVYGKKGAYLGTDLVFTFSPYTILKNRNEYDSEGTPVKAGESVSGWFALDFNMDQVDWDGNAAEITFVSEDNDLNTGLVSVALKKADPTSKETPQETDPSSEESPDSNNSDDEKTFNENSSTEENKAETVEETHPAVSFEDSLTVHTGNLSSDTDAGSLPNSSKMTVSVSAEAGTFPDGTTMVLSAVTDMDAVAEAVEGTVDSKTCGFQAVDISFRDKEGNEIEPLKPISVTMRSDSIKAATEDSSMAPVVVHVEDQSKKTNDATSDLVTTVMETLPSSVDNNDASESHGITDSSESISFKADSFSIYAIVYTVDFEYSVDGKMYQFSLPGGGFVSFTDLVEVLGIIGDTNSEGNGDETESVIVENAEENAANDVVEENSVNFDTNTALTLGDVEVSEATRNFVADVASVEFSTPSLVDVSKVEADTTVGQIKEGRGLECAYSAELTEEQITEINTQTVEAGDWALISVQPFTSEESLTVTMKNGEVFTIRVTDAQIKKTVIDAKGDTWEITVTYGEDAQIPDGAELKVREILPEDGKYEEYCEKAFNSLNAAMPEKESETVNLNNAERYEATIVPLPDKTEEIGFARYFDISIIYNEIEIEPNAPVKVKIEYVDPIEIAQDEELQIVHFAEDGIEVITPEIIGNEIIFEQDSFSVTATIVTNPSNPDWFNTYRYALLALYEGTYYEVMFDGKLQEVSPIEGTTNKYTVSMAEQWEWANEFDWSSWSSNNVLRVTTNEGTKYIDPTASSGISSSINDLTRTTSGSGYLLSSNNNYLGISTDPATGALTLSGTKNRNEAGTFFFASLEPTTTIGRTVDHIDIGVEAKASVTIPLAYGTYYYADGTIAETVAVGEYKYASGVNNEIPITEEDLMSATISSYTVENGIRVADNSFIINEYTSSTQVGEIDQVRIGGSFPVGWVSLSGNGERGDIERYITEQNQVHYEVAVTKNVNLILQKNRDGTMADLYQKDNDGNLVKLEMPIDVALTSSFCFWDDDNECPGIPYTSGYNRNGTGQNANASLYPAGMDFRLGTTSDTDASVAAIEIIKYTINTDGQLISVGSGGTFDFDIYQNAEGDVTAPVAWSGKTDANVDYSGYSKVDTRSITAGSTGYGVAYDYSVDKGLVYIEETGDLQNSTITDTDGNTWDYVDTYILTEYAWRDSSDNGNPLNNPKIHSNVNQDNTMRSIPDVVGDYYSTTYDGDLHNTFLEFYVYNVYKGGEVEFKKVDQSGYMIEGATFELYLTDPSEDSEAITAYRATSAKNEETGQVEVDFGSVAYGTYYMRETEAPEGYVKDTSIYRVEVFEGESGAESCKIERKTDDGWVELDKANNLYVFPNTPKYVNDFNITKVDENGKQVNGATLKFERLVSTDQGDQYVDYDFDTGTSGNQSTITIGTQDISLGTGKYRVSETTVPTGYEETIDYIYLTVNGEYATVTLTDSSGNAIAGTVDPHDSNKTTYSITNDESLVIVSLVETTTTNEGDNGNVITSHSYKLQVVNKSTSRGVKIRKVDTSETPVPLKDAKFNIVIDGTTYVLTSNEDGYLAFSGKIVDDVEEELAEDDPSGILTSLQSGSYVLSETVAPAGYIMLEGRANISVGSEVTSDVGTVKAYDADDNEIEDGDTETEVAYYVISIANAPGQPLPNTGGPGTRLFTILGSILMMFAGAMLVRKRRYI